LFKHFQLVWWCVCIHYFDCTLVSAFTNETQVSSPVTRMMWLRNSSSSLWHRSKNIYKFRCPLLRFVRTPDHFRNPSRAKLVTAWPNDDDLVKHKTWNLWKFLWKFWNFQAPSFTRSSPTAMADEFALHHDICSPTSEHSAPLSYSSFTPYIGP
jgi:hypothetical protein